MNIDTGELARLSADQLETLTEKLFRPVPEELQEEAMKALEGNDRTVIDLGAYTPLANWARQERQHRAKTNKAKMAKASKRRNRG